MEKINGYKKQKGFLGESISRKYMEKLGFEILETNYQKRGFEIDIICKKENTIVFVEVKYRKDMSYGHPLEAINRKKQGKIKKGAKMYIYENKLYKYDIRFDCIGIVDREIFYVENGF